MDFLPTDYESPKSNSSYMKIADGENKIRILTSPILGWEDWKDKKPIRFRMNQKPDKPIDEKKPIRHFWAMIVWNYTAQKIQILEITQATIRHRIEELSRDTDWGPPYHYDIKIAKTGSEQLTKYAINPAPAKELDPAIKTAFKELPIDLEALFSGEDPFKTAPDYRTKAFWESQPETPQVAEETIGIGEAADIRSRIFKGIAPIDKFWEEQALKAFKIKAWTELKKRHFDMVIKKIEEKSKQLAEEEIPF